jgi:16S rRNA (cytosine967-C5)-methyltransferase
MPNAQQPAGPRALAATILTRVDQKAAYADILLDQTVRRSSLSSADRALLTEIVYGTLRWRGRLDWHLDRALRRPLSAMKPYLRNVLRLTLYQCLFLDRVPGYAAVNEGVELAKEYGGAPAAGLVNRIAREILREKERLSYPGREGDLAAYLSVFWSHPEWLVRRWLDVFGADTESLLAANNAEAPLVLRTNRLRGGREGLIEALRRSGAQALPAAFSPQGVRVVGGASVSALPGFDEGLFQVQGEASQLLAYVLDPKPGERVLDACAAPGGKTTHIAELMEDRGEIVALDLSSRGLERLEENVRRLRLRSVRPVNMDATMEFSGKNRGAYDRVLIDAPCSGFGTLRSHPEAKWQKGEDDIRRLARLQEKILERAATYLRPGGILVYATCTLTAEENENQVEAFLSRHQEFVLEDAARYLPSEARDLILDSYFVALPHKHDTDGFFAARMRKQ